ncbi:phospholipase C type enzyme [Serendipita sp. 407]|nr:phospholipase C type enzyme [Serendipita sp. 407]
MSDQSLRVLSYNVWALKFVSKNRLERLDAISRALKASQYDIIAFQELWTGYDMMKATLTNLPYSKYWRTAAVGSGLAIFSRFPIIESHVYPYSLNGSPSDLSGDWFAGKACASVVIAHPLLGQVEIFNTHFFAKGGEEGPEYWRAVRISNAWEMSRLVAGALGRGRHVIVTGDFNSSPHSLPMKIMISRANLIDAWVESHPTLPSSPIGRNTSSNAARAIEVFGLTVDSPLNSWSLGKPLDPYARKWLGKRLDYILFRSPSAKSRPHLTIEETNVVMREKVPGRAFSFSDHFALEATFSVATPEDPVYASSSHAPRHTILTDKNQYKLSEEDLLTALGAISYEYREANKRSKRQMIYFWLSLLLLLFIVIGSAFIHPSRWLAPVATLLGAIATWRGTTALYVGFIYGQWETGILTNLMEEIEDVRDTYR